MGPRATKNVEINRGDLGVLRSHNTRSSENAEDTAKQNRILNLKAGEGGA